MMVAVAAVVMKVLIMLREVGVAAAAVCAALIAATPVARVATVLLLMRRPPTAAVQARVSFAVATATADMCAEMACRERTAGGARVFVVPSRGRRAVRLCDAAQVWDHDDAGGVVARAVSAVLASSVASSIFICSAVSSVSVFSVCYLFLAVVVFVSHWNVALVPFIHVFLFWKMSRRSDRRF